MKDWRDKAAALQAYAKQARNRQLEVDAAEIRIRAERRLGQMLDQDAECGERATRGRPAEMSPVPTLSELGISRDLSSRAQAIARIPEELFEKKLAQHRDVEIPITGRAMEQLINPAPIAHVAHSSGENEWYTPPDIIEAARRVMRGIDLDPASCATANRIVQASSYFDMQANGLAQRWHGRVWLNPPYARPSGKLLSRAARKLLAMLPLFDIPGNRNDEEIRRAAPSGRAPWFG